MENPNQINNFFEFSYDKIPDLVKNSKGKEQRITTDRIANVLSNVGVKIASILKHTGLDVNEREKQIDDGIKNLFDQLKKYFVLASNNKIKKITNAEKIPLFKKIQQSLSIYSDHHGNVKEALRYLTQIKAKGESSIVMINDRPHKSCGVWSEELSVALMNLYDNYSSIPIKNLKNNSENIEQKN